MKNILKNQDLISVEKLSVEIENQHFSSQHAFKSLVICAFLKNFRQNFNTA